MKSIITLALPALLSIHSAAFAECTSCKDKDEISAKTSVVKTEPSKLVKLSSGTGFIVSSTVAQTPFINETSFQFIEELGRLYFEKCREKKIGEWPFVITNVSKTVEAISNVPLQSTAFKISWIRFGKEELQSQAHLNTLIDALMEMRDKETCYVKFEGKHACFRVLVNEARIEGLNAVAKK